MNYKKVAEKITKARREQGVELNEMTEDLQIDNQRLQSYENGYLPIPENDLIDIIKYLNLDIDIENIEKDRTRENPKSFFDLFRYDDTVNKDSVPQNSRIFSIIKEGFKSQHKTNLADTFKYEMFEPKELVEIKPRLFARFFVIIILLLIATYFTSDIIFSNLIASMLVPVFLLVLLLELNNGRDIRGIDLMKHFFFGGILSIAIVTVARDLIGFPNIFLASDFLTAFLEETAKLIVVIYFLKKLRINNVYTAILVGFAVGAGFDVFETADYGLATFLEDAGTADEMYLVISMRSTYALFGIGHHFWTGLLAGTFTSLQKTNHFKINKIFHPIFITMYSIVIALHALWNFTADFESLYYLVVLVASLAIFVKFTKVQYMNDYHFDFSYQKSSIEV